MANQLKKQLECGDCGSETEVTHDDTDEINHCPVCGADLSIEEEDDLYIMDDDDYLSEE